MLKVLLIGNLGKDAEVNNVNGKSVINFSVAHAEKWKDQQGNSKEKTTWVECSYWTDKTAIAPYLKKGTQVYVEGTPEAGYYTSSAGEVVPKQKCWVNSIQLLGGGQQQQQVHQPTIVSGNNTDVEEVATDDLPF